MHKNITLLTIFLVVGLFGLAAQAKSLTTTAAQDFHLHQAADKIKHQQLAYAWGDLAYVVCKQPNHYIALQQMLTLAPQINKNQEMSAYFEKAIQQFPTDAILHALYATFLNNTGDQPASQKHFELALSLDPKLPNNYLPKIVLDSKK